MRFRELMKKEVVNTVDGSRLGYVCDIEIDVICGKACALFVPKPHNLFQKVQFLHIHSIFFLQVFYIMILLKNLLLQH